MDSDLFEDLDELDKAQFIGNFFKWMREIFIQRSSTPNYSETSFDKPAIKAKEA